MPATVIPTWPRRRTATFQPPARHQSHFVLWRNADARRAIFAACPPSATMGPCRWCAAVTMIPPSGRDGETLRRKQVARRDRGRSIPTHLHGQQLAHRCARTFCASGAGTGKTSMDRCTVITNTPPTVGRYEIPGCRPNGRDQQGAQPAHDYNNVRRFMVRTNASRFRPAARWQAHLYLQPRRVRNLATITGSGASIPRSPEAICGS